MPYNAEYPYEPLHPLHGGYAAIQTDPSQSVPIPCRAISVDTTGNYTITNPAGDTNVINLTAGIIHPISTITALSSLPTSAVVTYWY